MELSTKTTLLLTPKLHTRLKRLARLRRTSVGRLIREACESQYGAEPIDDRVAAVAELASLRLPVSSAAKMKREMVAPPKKLR
jgi:hypothetical protein